MCLIVILVFVLWMVKKLYEDDVNIGVWLLLLVILIMISIVFLKNGGYEFFVLIVIL